MTNKPVEKQFFQIREHGSVYRLYSGDGLESKPVADLPPFENPQVAKAACWQRFNAVAVRMYDDAEIPFNDAVPLHKALAAIEGRYSATNTVVAVGMHTYLVRRSRFGIEVQVLWNCSDGQVTARSDCEQLYSY